MAGEPARGYSWPQFQPGHTVNLVHGAEHLPSIEARAALVHQEIATVAPWLDEPHFAPAVHRYLRAAAREQLLDDHIANVCAEHGAGAVAARTWEQITAASRLAAKLGSDLGLDPIGHARLKAVAATAEVTSLGLSDLIAQGAQLRQEAQARMFDAAAAVRPVEALDPLEATDDEDGAF